MIGYLSKLEIDFEMAYKRGLKDRYAWHQKTWDLFPNRPDDARDFLTQLEEQDTGFRLLVLSQSEPVRPDWCPTDRWASRVIPDSFLQQSDSFHFSLVANATRKMVVRDENGKRKKNGVRVPLTKDSDLVNWLSRKGGQHGFKFAPNRIRTASLPRQYFMKNNKSGIHQPAGFRGILQATDTERLREAFIHGIGTAKAFGYGMLCLVPVNDNSHHESN